MHHPDVSFHLHVAFPYVCVCVHISPLYIEFILNVILNQEHTLLQYNLLLTNYIGNNTVSRQGHLEATEIRSPIYEFWGDTMELIILLHTVYCTHLRFIRISYLNLAMSIYCR